jgi:3-isopropylmalate/(R)-2-methylmalate dehydratase small subunit
MSSVNDSVNHRVSDIEGVAAPLPIANLDTDQIMPKQFLRIIGKEGLDKGVFYDLRYDAGADGAPRSEFVLNQPAYANTSILIAGPNFGCGSSREHAVWGLQQLGIKAVIAPSFGEIFFSNAFNNRLPLIVLKQSEVEVLAADLSASATKRMRIDLQNLRVQSPTAREFAFSMNARHRQMIAEGLDLIGTSMKYLHEIESFEQRHFARYPWAQVLSGQP